MKSSRKIYNSFSFFFVLLFSLQCFVGVHSFLLDSQTLQDKIVLHKFFTTNRNGGGHVYKKARNNFSLTSTYASLSTYEDNNNIGSNKKNSKRNMKIFQMRSLQNGDSTDSDNKGEDTSSSSFYFHDEKSDQENDANEMGAQQQEEDTSSVIDVVDEAEESALNNLAGKGDETTSSTKFLRFNKGFGAPKDPPPMRKPKGRKPTTHRMDMRSTPNGGNMGVMPKTSDKPGERVFDLFVEYPCKFQMKVIGLRDENFEKDMVEIVAKVVEKPAETIEHRTRDKGKYRSVTIEAPVENSDQVYECYAKLSEDPRVIYKI